MANCRIRYTATSIKVDFEPGCANFSYWVYWKVPNERWRQTGEGIRLGCEVSEDEADYIEKTAVAQWGEKGCEVIGRAAPVQIPVPEVKPKPEIKAKPAKPEKIQEVQLSLFSC